MQVPTTQGNPSAGGVPDAKCSTGAPENGVQGEVPLSDRNSGRSEKGYACNLTFVGGYQGTGASWVSQSYKKCAYLSAAFPGDQQGSQPGVRVVDASNQAHPKLSEILTSPAMTSGTWESLKVNSARGLLAAVSGGAGDSAGFFDVYDISKDCAHPTLLNSLASTALTLPANGIGHEGGWAPDGLTYYSSSLFGGNVTAIDVSNPAKPQILWTGLPNLENHGFSLSPDGNTLYLANLVNGAGMDVFDVSQIQHRYLLPQPSFVGGIRWTDGSVTQATIPVTVHGHPYVIAWDELGDGGVRFLDIADPRYPTITSQIRLQINMPANASAASADTANTGAFGYQSHYCTVDRQVNPTALACGWFQSGIRVLDIRDIQHPREIAFYNPPAQTGKNAQLSDSSHAGGGSSTQLTADWCSSPPSFVGNELWATCQDNGFMILKFAPGTYPYSKGSSAGA
ncbi:MAG: hypothetical protein JO156_10220 [Solirubrobacterales bacterium]|nr:hypothetical protein [Solirubrobacterales bacterium]